MTNDVYFIKLIDHPNVLKGHEFYEEKDSFYFVHELFQGGSIEEKIT